MAIFKEVVRGDGSGIAEYYRVQDGRVMNVDYSMVTNKPTLNGVTLSGDLTMEDFGMDIEGAVETLTGEEISKLKKDDNKIVLCTTDYMYTDDEGIPVQMERGSIYEIYQGVVVDRISVGGSGGGGGSSNPRSNFTTAVSELEQRISVNSKLSLSYKFVTTAIPNTGVAKLYINNVLKGTKNVTSGNTYEFDVSSYIKEGTNYFTIKTTDEYGAEKTLDFIINAIQLGITTTFNDGVVLAPNFDFIYTLKGAGEKTLHFIVDGEESTEIQTSINVPIKKSFNNLSHGLHTLQVYASVILNEEEMVSNTLDYTIMVADPTSSEDLIYSSFNKTDFMEGDIVTVDYLVYDHTNDPTTVQLCLNDEVVNTVEVDRSRKYWRISSYPTGDVKVSIKLNDTTKLEYNIFIEELDIELNAVTDSLSLYLNAANRSNEESIGTRDNWSYENIEAEFIDFTWKTDGWIDNALKFKGRAKGNIPYHIFGEDIRATGKTVEVEFTTHEAFNHNALLLSCMTEGKGFEIYQNHCTIASEQTSVTAKYSTESRIRVSFVIEGLSSNRLIKTYINGVLSGLSQYAATDNFQQAVPVGISLNNDEEEFDIHCIRIYDRELTSTEILHNYLYDMNDVEMKLQLFTNNLIYDDYGNVSYVKLKSKLPSLIITGELPPAKGEKRTVSCLYENTKDTTYNFDYDGCTIDVQGTSSQYYPRKNWKIKLPEKIKFHENAIEEDTFCFKTDYMETSHSHNIGTAILANSLPKELFPTRQENELVRDTMYGFPCVIFHRETIDDVPQFYGTFMFNNDKSNSDTLGLTTEKAESWEFRNNTSDHCLFKTNDFSAAAKPEDNLEARYPDKNTDYTNIKKLYDWVVSCKDDVDKFKAEFNQHLNLEYCLNYQVLMEFALLTDSRAKNMFLDTVDGEIWYPRFYDMDTCWGLNNEGVLSYSYDANIHDAFGSGYVWNDRGESVLWNLFEQAFEDEIKAKYHELRKSHLTYDNLLKIYITDIASHFPEASYNEDAYFKYVLPLLQNNDGTYLYAAQGNRTSHFKYILSNRIKYLDSKYKYGEEYNANYATMRLYTKKADFDITTYTTEYVDIKFGSTIEGARCIAGTPTTIKSPSGLEFNDTETIIYGANAIASLGDLSEFYPGTVDITRCEKLQDLIIGPKQGTNTNLHSISLGNNKLLRKIDLRNCPNLKGDLDLSSCTDLREVYLTGSGITSITLPDTGSVKILHLPASLTTLILKNQKLEEIRIEGYQNLQAIDIVNTTIPQGINTIVFSSPNLSRLNIGFSENTISSIPITLLQYYTEHLNGMDKDGFNTPVPGFTGDVVVNIPKYFTTNDDCEEIKESLIETYPQLNITYVTDTTEYFRFYGYKTTTSSNLDTYPLGYYYTTTGDNGAEFFGVYLYSVNSANHPELLYFPEKYKNKPVKMLSTGLSINPSTYDYPRYANTGTFEGEKTLGANNGTAGLPGSPSSPAKFIIIPNTYELGYSDFCFDGSQLMSVSNRNKVLGIGNYSVKLISLGDLSECEKLAANSSLPKFSSCKYEPISVLHRSVFLPKLKYLSSTSGSSLFLLSSASRAWYIKDIDWSKIELVRSSYDFSDEPNAQQDMETRLDGLMTTSYPLICRSSVLEGLSEWLDIKGEPWTDYYNRSTYKGIYQGVYFKGQDIDLLNYTWNNHTPIVCSDIRAHSFINLDKITSFSDTSSGVGGYDIRFGPLYSDTQDVLEFTGIERLVSNQTINSTSHRAESPLIDTSGTPFSFPNLKELDISTIIGGYNTTIIKPLIIPDNVKIFNANTTSPYNSLIRLVNVRWADGIVPLFDASETTCVRGDGYHNMLTYAQRNKQLKGFKDLGKAFDPTKGANYIYYTFGGWMSNEAPAFSIEDWINILDNLYDIASIGVPTQKVCMGSMYNKINSEPTLKAAVERATEKGWTITNTYS